MTKEKAIGEVYSYHENDSLVYVILYDHISAGQTLHFLDPEGDYFVTPDHFQVASQQVHEAYKGDYAGIFVDRQLKSHDKVFVETV